MSKYKYLMNSEIRKELNKFAKINNVFVTPKCFGRHGICGDICFATCEYRTECKEKN